MRLFFTGAVSTSTALKIGHYKAEDIDLFILSNSMGSGNRLIFNCWIPMRTSEVHLLEVLKIKPFTRGLNLYYEHVRA